MRADRLGPILAAIVLALRAGSPSREAPPPYGARAISAWWSSGRRAACS